MLYLSPSTQPRLLALHLTSLTLVELRFPDGETLHLHQHGDRPPTDAAVQEFTEYFQRHHPVETVTLVRHPEAAPPPPDRDLILFPADASSGFIYVHTRAPVFAAGMDIRRDTLIGPIVDPFALIGFDPDLLARIPAALRRYAPELTGALKLDSPSDPDFLATLWMNRPPRPARGGPA